MQMYNNGNAMQIIPAAGDGIVEDEVDHTEGNMEDFEEEEELGGATSALLEQHLAHRLRPPSPCPSRIMTVIVTAPLPPMPSVSPITSLSILTQTWKTILQLLLALEHRSFDTCVQSSVATIPVS